MEGTLSCKYGVANNFETSTSKNFEVAMPNVTFSIGNVIPMFRSMAWRSRGIDGHSKMESGWSTSLDIKRSKVKALGELIERFSSIYRGEEACSTLVFDSYDNLVSKGLVCMDFSDVIHFEDQSYEDFDILSKYSTCRPVSWIKAKNLIYESDIWLPAQKVFLSYPYSSKEKEHLHIWGLSTGLACGSNYEQAALSAILEVIERDSFMLTWRLQLPSTRIEVDVITNSNLKRLYRHILKHMVGSDEMFIYDISRTDGVYSILTFIRNNLQNGYGLIVSAASHVNIEIALLKSLEELCQSQAYAYHKLVSDEGKAIQHLEEADLTSLDNHFFYYSASRNNKNIDFIFKDENKVYLSELSNYSCDSRSDLEYVVELFHKSNQDIYIADVTKPEIIGIGLKVLKAVIPGYLDIDANHHFLQTKNDRLKSFQKKHGSTINRNPHPFP